MELFRGRRTFGALLSLAGLLCALPAMAQRPPARVPTEPAEVLERLPRGFTAASAPRPGRVASLQQINTLLSLAVSTGDSRLAARANRLLQTHPADSNHPEVLRARSFVAQHGHHFAEALALLDRLVAAHPRDGDALLSRSQIHLVQGDLRSAGRDCAGLILGIDASLGAACIAAIALRRGQYPDAARTADRALEAAGTPEQTRNFLVLRAEIASRAREPDADGLFERALAVSPTDVRTLAAYARHLRYAKRVAGVENLLKDAPSTDTLLLERALAARALGAPNAQALAAELERRFKRARAAGDIPELREEAEFALTLKGDAPRALQLALENFKTQRDAEDVELLVRSASRAKRPDALKGLREWSRASGVPLTEPTP